MPKTKRSAGARQTITIPIQKIRGFGPTIRSHLRDVLVPFPAPDGEPYAISKVARDIERDVKSYLWTGNFDDGFLDNAPIANFSRELMDRCGGAAFHLEREDALFDLRNTLLNLSHPTYAFDVIFFPQGAVMAASGPAEAMAHLGWHDGKGEITPEIARRVFKVIEGPETSSHERLELLRASNAFIGAYLAQESADDPHLEQRHLDMLSKIELKVVSTSEA